MLLEPATKAGAALEIPRVNHGRAEKPNAMMTGESAATTMSMRVALTGGVTDLVRRMLIERSIESELTQDADLRDVGLTSLDMVDLVLSVECAFDVRIPEAQITPANFRSIAAIDALLDALRGAQH
jgi:acyl carrier protein